MYCENVTKAAKSRWNKFIILFISIPSLELMKRSLLQRLPQVALTCLAFLSWLAGPVITQHRTRTFSAIWSASFLSSGK